MPREDDKNDKYNLEKRLIDFAVRIIAECDELISIFVTSVRTAEKNKRRQSK